MRSLWMASSRELRNQSRIERPDVAEVSLQVYPVSSDALFPLPNAADIERYAELFEFRDDVTDAFLAALVAFDEPSLREQFIATQRSLLSSPMGTKVYGVDWPDAPVPMFYAVVLLSLVPHAYAIHQNLGVDESTTKATLWDIGQQVHLHWRRTGVYGLKHPGWLSLHLRGQLFQLGRLQFAVENSGQYGEGGPAFGDPVAGMHIPERGRLDPESIDESMDIARGFSGLGGEWQFFTCDSWLLDPQLARHLDPGSNIVRFGARFTLTEGQDSAEWALAQFVFDQDLGEGEHLSFDELAQDTPLQRALVAHLRDGGEWHQRWGWIER